MCSMRSSRRSVAIIHPGLSLGGAGAVAIWMLEALKNDYDVTLIITENRNFSELNSFFGTNLEPNEVQVRVLSHLSGIVLGGFLVKVALAQRYYRQHRNEYDLGIATRCEMDLGEPGIQYIHYPIWNDRSLRDMGQLPEGRQYRDGVLRRSYQFLCRRMSRFNEEKMCQNLTLVNSNWTGERVREIYGINALTVYPPVKGDFPKISWDEREEGFVCLGAVSPGKHIEDMIAIIGGVRQAGFRIHLHIIGRCSDPAYGKQIMQLCEQNRKWLFWEGGLPRKQLVYVVAKHKYGIHGMPKEHFGIAVAEMVKAGCIPFVPHSGGQLEIVGDDRLLYYSREEAVAKICDILQHQKIQVELREHLRDQGQKFSTIAFMRTIKEVVKRVLSGEKDVVA